MKKLSVRVGEYQGQDGNMKGRYVNVGVLMTKQDGKEYILLDPSISLAGLMTLQNAEAMKKGEPLRDRIMTGLFEEEQNNQGAQQSQQQGGYQQQQQGGGQQGYQPTSQQQQQHPQDQQNYGGHRG
jgi:hypothetical protein